MFIVAASSLHHAIQTLPKNSRKRLNTYVLAIPGATLQTFVRNRNKSLSFLLQYPLRKTENINLWHDIVNNAISQHKSNFYKPCSPQELIGSVLKIKHRLSAISYCRKIGALNVLQQLQSTGVLVIDLGNDLLPARQVRKPFFLEEFQQLHQKAILELRTLAIIRRYQNQLHRFTKKKTRLSKRRRAAKRNKQSSAVI